MLSEVEGLYKIEKWLIPPLMYNIKITKEINTTF